MRNKVVSVALLILFLVGIFLLYCWLAFVLRQAEYSVSHGALTDAGPNYLEPYTITNLARRGFSGSDFRVEKTLKESPAYTSYLFSFRTRGKKVTGRETVPQGKGPFPTVIMVRGFVDAKSYSTGVGSAPLADFLSAHGFLTLAPDFLGYGGSDAPSADPFEERFQTYTTLLDLYGLVSSSNGNVCHLSLVACHSIFLWGHSNGGQITLTFLEVIGEPIPTVLWAPVSKPFPYSILYFTDDAADNGSGLRRLVAKFESHYDATLYSLTNYLGLIKAPILLQQGMNDEIVPPWWSASLARAFKDKNINVIYKTYAGADHNLLGAWPQAAADVLKFYQSH